MSRPNHLNTPNTAEGIRRINEMQSHYDEDPAAYEAEQLAHEQELQEREQAEAEDRARYEEEMASQAAEAEADSHQDY